jgi:hypothetical protein
VADPAAKDLGRVTPDCIPVPGSALRAPFVWFGGKSRVAPLVWPRFGDVAHYVEPFAGSLAVLLARPDPQGIEVVNDRDAYLSNFWRAIAGAPDLVAYHADQPVNETDLHARHAWLCGQYAFRDRMMLDPEYFDAKIAGWWVWGIAQWIGGGWCEHPEWKGRAGGYRAPRGLNRQLEVAGERADVFRYFEALAARLREVRVCCGDWARVLKPSPTTREGVTAVFLDPPYATDRYMVYSHDSMFLAHEVREWAIHNGDDPRFRIALCGRQGEHQMPDSWTCAIWKAARGYSLEGDNAERERCWFSPHCVPGHV